MHNVLVAHVEEPPLREKFPGMVGNRNWKKLRKNKEIRKKECLFE
jgi:hypothetical protein